MSRKIFHVGCHCCGSLFYTRSVLTKYCSRRCSNKAFRSKTTPTQADLKKLFEQQNGLEDNEQDQVAA
ncbi:hypothetical protein [Pseudomonas nitroreducens]|uniref:hypothetical protein n=1 Tax=Pseudomonas nitroreducens TaxID=46680 RepID=UPI003D281398